MLLSDQGPQVTSGAWQKAIRISESKAWTTAAYSPESNSRLERMIQTIKRALAICIYETEKEFDDVLQGISSGYNTRAVSYALSPYKLLYRITSTHVSHHITARSKICNITENIVDIVDGDVWSDRTVQVVAEMSLQAARFILWRPPYHIHLNVGSVVLVERSSH